ncbi:ABC transporter ATP-binding protein [Aureimonas sp. AU4]|uniref:dipeptide ABC transporter ATP-binding protein n=1 Tax=Aureimonas sp. AU4 TaxID=1638163 RepID=UPI000783C81B|nr:ABC transporter ATP-binding protein [Aureimonas sp. AU4]
MSAAHASIPPLRIEGLSVSYDGRAVIQGVDFAVRPGEVVALVGESGSGKTTTAQAVIGLLPANGRVESGRVLLGGEDVSGWSDRRLSALRGRVVSLIPQDPGSSLDPVQTIGTQLGEVFRLHGHRDRRTIRAEVLDLLRRVGLSQPELRFAQYPHELSGGMKQRVLIAIALALKPRLVIADEPTSALDVTVQRRILDLIDELRREHGTAVLLVTHDLAVAADRADRIVVMRGGRIVEQGDARSLLAAPRETYTQRLLGDAPAFAAPTRRPPTRIDEPPIVEVVGLVHDFPTSHGRSRAVDGIGFRIASGTTHALVGESGSGKTTTGRAVLGLLQPTAGRVAVAGQDVAKLRGAALRSFRRTIQLVYQNPFASLDPHQSVREIVEEPLLNFEPVPRAERRGRVAAILERVHLPADLAERYPAALSGGQRQRVAIARALILRPRVLVLDEAVSALDVTVQAQILRLLDELQRDLGLTYLFISHDLAVVRAIADTVSVLRAGKVVEEGCVEDVFVRPSAAYTRELIDAIPGRARPTSSHEVAST